MYLLYHILLHHMHALTAVNTPIRDWKVYQTHSEYRILMVDGNLMMLLAMMVDHRLPGQMMLKAVETFHYCVLQFEIYTDFNMIITHYIIIPSSVHIENSNCVQYIRLHLGEGRH